MESLGLLLIGLAAVAALAVAGFLLRRTLVPAGRASRGVLEAGMWVAKRLGEELDVRLPRNRIPREIGFLKRPARAAV